VAHTTSYNDHKSYKRQLSLTAYHPIIKSIDGKRAAAQSTAHGSFKTLGPGSIDPATAPTVPSRMVQGEKNQPGARSAVQRARAAGRGLPESSAPVGSGGPSLFAYPRSPQIPHRRGVSRRYAHANRAAAPAAAAPLPQVRLDLHRRASSGGEGKGKGNTGLRRLGF
jgi:hypothetical protein